MIATLLLGALAGWGAQQIETQVTDLLFRFLGQENMIADQDRSVAALMLCLIVAALVLTVLGLGGQVLLFVVAATLGYFQEDLREMILNRRA